MKILIATDNYYPNVNGASYFAQRHARQLKDMGHDVLVLAPSRSRHSERFEHDGVPIFGISSMPIERIRIPIPLINYSEIRAALEEFHPDIIHIQSHFTVGRKTARIGLAMGIPVVGTNHFMPENLVHFFPMFQYYEQQIKDGGWAFAMRTLRKINAVTSPTHIAAGLLQKVGLPRTVEVISNGIDLKRFNSANNGDYLKELYKLSNLPILLFVGRLDKEKNLDFVIRALPEVVAETPLNFVIAGSGAERGKLEALVDQLGLRNNVTFLGFVPDEDLPNLYPLAQCFMMSGTAELQSIATMEAMATDLPVVAVNAMALPELVHDGENGYLYAEGNSAQLISELKKIFGDAALRKSMGEKSKQYIAPHDISAVGRQFVALYERLVKERVTA